MTAPREPWEPITPTWSYGNLSPRSPALYAQALDQFDVEHARVYQPRHGDTFCNIYVWDATRACGCELPHWWLREELSANAMCVWLVKHGSVHGWQRMRDALQAQMRASAGFPTVATWRNPGVGPGHIAMVRPGGEPGVPLIAQAGSRCFANEPLSHGFGDLPVQFWSHD